MTADPPLWRRWLARARDVLFPPQCAFCEEVLPSSRVPQGFCADCDKKLSWITPPFCSRCGIPFGKLEGTAGGNSHLCGECIRHPPPYELARTALRYESPAREAILSLKFSRRTDLTGALVFLLERTYAEMYREEPVPSLLCAVPLHPSRLRERHFDQSALLARKLGRRVGVPVQLDLLRRTRKTESQTGLARPDRARNVRGAFEMNGSSAAEGKHVLLLDDVLTTGATAGECARVLLQEGKARRVDVLCVARAVPE